MIHRTCRICSSDLPAPFLDLGEQPLANNLLSDPADPPSRFPLAMTKCRACHLVQLTEVVPPDLLFSEYLYTPSQSTFFKEHFEAMAKTLEEKTSLHGGDLVVDVGSNDGTLLSYFQRDGMRIVGVEPARNLALAARNEGIPTLARYFSGDTVTLILQDYGHPMLITATNVCAHVNDVLSFGRAVARLLDEEGVFVVETPSLAVMLRDGLFDTAYHEHLSTWSLHTLRAAFVRCGLKAYDVEEVASHGGSLRVYFDKGVRRPMERLRVALDGEQINEGSYAGLMDHARLTRHKMKSYLLERKGSVVAGYTSPAKATVLLNYCGLTGDDISYIVDDSPLKLGKWVPTGGKPIPIVGFERFESEPPDIVLLNAWNLKAELAIKLRSHGVHGELVVPLPSFEIMRAVYAKREDAAPTFP